MSFARTVVLWDGWVPLGYLHFEFATAVAGFVVVAGAVVFIIITFDCIFVVAILF